MLEKDGVGQRSGTSPLVRFTVPQKNWKVRLSISS